MIKALWLTSWYPNKLDAMNGDFIQRHAHAVSAFAKVDVIHAEPDVHLVMQNKPEEIMEQGPLTEHIYYYPPAKNENLLSRIFSGVRYTKMMKKAVQKYIQKNGLPNIVHVHVPIKAGIVALWLKRKYGIPFIVTEHWAIYNQQAKDNYSTRDFIFKYYTRKIFREAGLFLPVSKELGEAVNKMVLSVPYKPVPNVADTSIFHFVEKVNDPAALFTFIHVSTLKPQKNPEGILRVFAKFSRQYPHSKLWMVGDNASSQERLAKSLGLKGSQVEFTGLISYMEVAEKMKMADAFILFSRFENLPCVLIEALCCGLPVISTNVGGIAEMLDASNGLLIEYDNEDQLFRAMEKVCQNYQTYDRRKISEEARSKYAYHTIGETIYKVYQSQLKN